MKKITAACLAAFFAVILVPFYCIAESGLSECSPEELFDACDINRNGIITREEWYTIDTDRDDIITSEEWDRYKYKSEEKKTSPFQIRYYDVYGDETTGKEEFFRNFKRLE
jgi:hypothetical protein